MTTAETLTDSQIEALAHEAGCHGDDEMVAICERALDGDPDAREEVALCIRAAQG
jgi:hypothetical protein